MAANIDVNSLFNLPPDVAEQQQSLQRQQALANMLIQNGQQQPQGQMVSGHYVAPSFAQYLAPLANTAVGVYKGNQVDKRTTELAQALRGQQEKEITQFGELLKTDPNQAYQFAAKSYTPQLREVEIGRAHV